MIRNNIITISFLFFTSFFLYLLYMTVQMGCQMKFFFFLLQIIFYTFQLMLKASNTIKLLFEKQVILLGYFRFKFSDCGFFPALRDQFLCVHIITKLPQAM